MPLPTNPIQVKVSPGFDAVDWDPRPVPVPPRASGIEYFQTGDDVRFPSNYKFLADQYSGLQQTMGPFSYKNAYWGVFVDTRENTIEIWKSEDWITWFEVDSINHPTCRANTSSGISSDYCEYTDCNTPMPEYGLESFGLAVNIPELYVVYYNIEAKINISTFDMDSETWTDIRVGGPFPFSTGFSSNPVLLLEYRTPPNDDFVVIYQGPAANREIDEACTGQAIGFEDGIALTRVFVTFCKRLGSFSGSLALTDVSSVKSFHLVSSVNSGDYIHLFMNNYILGDETVRSQYNPAHCKQWSVDHISIDRSNTWGALQTLNIVSHYATNPTYLAGTPIVTDDKIMLPVHGKITPFAINTESWIDPTEFPNNSSGFREDAFLDIGNEHLEPWPDYGDPSVILYEGTKEKNPEWTNEYVFRSLTEGNLYPDGNEDSINGSPRDSVQSDCSDSAVVELSNGELYVFWVRDEGNSVRVKKRVTSGSIEEGPLEGWSVETMIIPWLVSDAQSTIIANVILGLSVQPDNNSGCGLTFCIFFGRGTGSTNSLDTGALKIPIPSYREDFEYPVWFLRDQAAPYSRSIPQYRKPFFPQSG